jgi:hypothetical protein
MASTVPQSKLQFCPSHAQCSASTRKTGYKLINRDETAGLDGIHELSRRPHRSPHAVGDDVAGPLVEARTDPSAVGSAQGARESAAARGSNWLTVLGLPDDWEL